MTRTRTRQTYLAVPRPVDCVCLAKRIEIDLLAKGTFQRHAALRHAALRSLPGFLQPPEEASRRFRFFPNNDCLFTHHDAPWHATLPAQLGLLQSIEFSTIKFQKGTGFFICPLFDRTCFLIIIISVPEHVAVQNSILIREENRNSEARPIDPNGNSLTTFSITFLQVEPF